METEGFKNHSSCQQMINTSNLITEMKKTKKTETNGKSHTANKNNLLVMEDVCAVDL